MRLLKELAILTLRSSASRLIHLERKFWRAPMSSLQNASQGWVERERIDFRDDPAAGATVVTSPCLQTRAARHPSYSRGMGLFSGSLYIKVRACADAGPCHSRSCSVHAAVCTYSMSFTAAASPPFACRPALSEKPCHPDFVHVRAAHVAQLWHVHLERLPASSHLPCPETGSHVCRCKRCVLHSITAQLVQLVCVLACRQCDELCTAPTRNLPPARSQCLQQWKACVQCLNC